MIDRTTFDLRIAAHDTTTARVNAADWQRQTALAGATPETARGARQRRRPALRARLAIAATLLGGALALGMVGLPASAVVGADPQVTTLAVDDQGCIHASAAGLPGEGCGPARPTLIPVGAAGDAPGCVYASAAGVPGEGCRPARTAGGDGRP